jgi:iron(III) transport system substrate-binding protein
MPIAATSTAALCCALASLALAACSATPEDSAGGPPEPETEGITLYSGRIATAIGGAIDAYEAEADRDVQVRFADTGDLAATLVEEGGNSPADVFFAQDAGALDALSAEGLLAKLPDDVLAQVPERFRSPEGEWVGTSARARVIAYGEGVRRSELPRSVLDLTDPKWEGRVGWAPTNGSFEAFVTAMRATLGEERTREWLEGMVANDVQAYDSNIPIRDAVAEGEIDLGLINHYYVAQAKAEDPGYAVDVHFPPGDLGSMVNTAGVGVLKSTDDRAEAIAFVREMLARPSQEFFAESSFEYPVVSGVPADPGLIPLQRIPDPGIDLAQLSDLEGTLELLRDTGVL